jgi:hypothetical protein
MNVIAEVESLKSQQEFVHSPATFPAIIGGYGSGKSTGGLYRIMNKKIKNLRCPVAIYAPTYGVLRDVWFDKLEEFAQKYKMKYFLNKSAKEMYLQGASKIIMRSLDDPASIIGFEVADSIVDEIDTIPKTKAEDCWKKVIARNRFKKPKGEKNTVGAVTTPEGFRFAYNRWEKNKTEKYVMYRADTRENSDNLPEEYISDLIDSYDPILLQAYLSGLFVNMTQGSIYYAFEQERHIVDKPMPVNPALPLNLCVDFNVNPMNWVLTQHTSREDIRVLHEISMPNSNTPKMCKELLAWVPKNREGRCDLNLVVYGDASGGHRDTRSNGTDYTIIDQELRSYFNSVKYRVPEANPAVETRIKCVNARLAHNTIRLNPIVKEIKEDFIQCVRNKYGEVDKSDLLRTHASDALGYYIAFEFPIIIKSKSAEVKFR